MEGNFKMKSRCYASIRCAVIMFLAILCVPQIAFSADEITELRKQMEEQQALIKSQQRQLEQQAQAIER